MSRLSKLAMRLQGQGMFRIKQRADELEKQGKNILHFEVGDPYYNPPLSVEPEMEFHISHGETHYVSSRGISELLSAAQDATEKSRSFRPNIRQLLVTPGVNWQLYAAMACTCNPDDSILIPDPGFASYSAIANMLGVKILTYRDVGQFFDKVMKYKLKLAIVNSPCNPTGKVFAMTELDEMAKFCCDHYAYLLSDEIYSRMIYEKKFFSPSALDKCQERVIVANGFSKSYAMTGFRLGVMTGPEDVIDKCRLLLETEQTCVSPFVQWAGVAALQTDTNWMLDDLRKKRDRVVAILWNIGLSCEKPDGAFYVWVKSRGIDGDKFADDLLIELGVAVCPGSVFGLNGRDYVRLCFAVPDSQLDELENRLRMFKEVK